MKIKLPFNPRKRGYVIILVMILCAASLLILSGILSYTTTTSNLNMRSNELSLCQNAAEAATEKVYAKMAADFAYGIGQVTNNYVNGVYATLVPTASDNSYFGKFNFYDPTTSTNPAHIYVHYLENYSGALPTQYTNDFAATNSVIYRIVSNVSMPGAFNSDVIGTAQEDVLFALVPINTYAIFYNGELEFSDCATMTVSGRTHSNSDICTGSSSKLTFNGAVTTSSVIWSPERGNISYSPVNEQVTYNAGSITDVTSVQISIPMTNTHSIIDIPASPSITQAQTPTGQQLEYYQAQVVLLISNSPSAASGPNPAVYVSLQNSISGNVPGADPNPYVFLMTNVTSTLLNTATNYWNATNVNQITLNQIRLPFLNLAGAFTDEREYQTNFYLTQIDIGAYRNWVLTNVMLISKMPSSGNLFPTILYVADKRTGGNKFAAVRMVNARQLPYNNNIGFSIATPNPLYVWGNYNTTTNGTTFSTAIGSTTNGFTVPSALLCDAITILSPSWQDSQSAGPFGSRDASSMTINAAIVTGNVPSTGTSATTFSGGVHNLTRLLEDWTGTQLTYNTSIVCLYSSTVATNQFQMPGGYYDPPTRNWGFDPTFYNPAREPPGIPEALVAIRFNWQQPPPGSVTTGIN